MEKTVAVTVYVDVEISKGGRAECERLAKSVVAVGSTYGCGTYGFKRAAPSKRELTAVCID